MSNPMIDLILGGAVDEDIDLIANAANQRRRIVAEQRALSLKPGDTFRVHNISPKKLDGVVVRLIEHKGNDLRCELLTHVDGRYPRGSTLILRRTHVAEVLS